MQINVILFINTSYDLNNGTDKVDINELDTGTDKIDCGADKLGLTYHYKSKILTLVKINMALYVTT